MVEEYRKVHRPKFRIGLNVMAGISILGKHAAAILKGQKSLEPPRRSSNVGGVSYNS
jgi:hypothetical protein